MYITRAAIMYPNGEVVTSSRHYKIIALQAKLGIPSKGDCIQGFVADDGKFYTREEAKIMAIESGQIKPDFKGTLYSEDLWPDSIAEQSD